MVKYTLSTREFSREESKGFPETSDYISPYILTPVIIQTFTISEKVYFKYGFSGRAIW